MIYFLVNNNYHLDLDFRLASELSDCELGLIQVPYSLELIKGGNVFSKIIHFTDKIFLSVSNPGDIFRVQKEVKGQIQPKKNDVLLVHTDMDLLNQYIIQRFYEAEARIFLLEDGTATMCTYNIPPKRASLKNRFKEFLLRNIYGMKYTSIFVYGAETLPVMKDHIFRGVIVNRGSDMLRKMPLYRLPQKKEPFEMLNAEGAIFYNQGLYLWYCSEDEYVDFVKDILAVSKHFDPFYFKFHPYDTDSIKDAINELIDHHFPHVIVVTENEPAERIAEKYPVKYTITFNSTAALNLINRGVVPVFLNHLYHNKYPDPSFAAFNKFLDSIKCKVPAELSEVRPGFEAFPESLDESETHSIREILNL